MSGERTVLTYRDYAALPDDGRRYEILDGELSVTPAPVPRHQQISGALHLLLGPHVKGHRLGELLYAPIDIILADTTIVQPDLVYLDATRTHLISGRGIEGPPTLVIEILSPSTTRNDRGIKLELYRRYRVPYYWIVDPDARTIEAFGLGGGRYLPFAKVSGAEAVSLQPFSDLTFAPASLWP